MTSPFPFPSRLLGAALLAATLCAHAAAGDAAAGQRLYQTHCAACHSSQYNGVGPAHRGVFGRRAGSAPGYAYSDAVKNSGVVWTEANLTRWLTDPEAFIPGQKMGFQVEDPAARADLIAYLRTLTN
jgi:cytochrome c